MERQLKFEVDGQAVALEDVQLLAEQAAFAQDLTLQTLLQPDTVLPAGNRLGRYVIPLYQYGSGGQTSLITPGGADAKVNIRPFAALIGGSSAVAGEVWTDSRFVRSPSAEGTTGADQIQLAATIASNRIDLIYAKFTRDQDEAAVVRAVKLGDESVTAQSISAARSCKIELGVAQGVEGATPARPALPTDAPALDGFVPHYVAGTVLYIPLAYVRLTHPHSLTSQITTRQITELAQRPTPSTRVGAVSMRPANQQYKIGGSILESPSAGLGSGVVRPSAHLAPSLSGLEVITVALSFNGSGTGRSLALSGTHVLDDSADWRFRAFRCTWYVAPASSPFAWDNAAGNNPGPGAFGFTKYGLNFDCWGHSFHADANWITDGVADAGPVTKLSGGAFAPNPETGTFTTLFGSGSVALWFFVDMTDGKLKVKVGATDPSAYIFGHIMASGPNSNVGF